MTRAVLDTNIYISGLLFAGIPGKLLDFAIDQVFRLIISSPILDELEDKLRTKFAIPMRDAATIRSKIESIADVCDSTTQ